MDGGKDSFIAASGSHDQDRRQRQYMVKQNFHGNSSCFLLLCLYLAKSQVSPGQESGERFWTIGPLVLVIFQANVALHKLKTACIIL